MLGPLLGLLAGIAWGTSTILARLGLQHLQPSMGTRISMVARLALILFLAILIAPKALMEISLKAMLLFAGIGILNYTLALFFNYAGIQKLGASRSAPIVASAPLFAVLLATAFLREVPTPWMLLGALSIFAGLFVLTSGGES